MLLETRRCLCVCVCVCFLSVPTGILYNLFSLCVSVSWIDTGLGRGQIISVYFPIVPNAEKCILISFLNLDMFDSKLTISVYTSTDYRCFLFHAKL